MKGRLLVVGVALSLWSVACQDFDRDLEDCKRNPLCVIDGGKVADGGPMHAKTQSTLSGSARMTGGTFTLEGQAGPPAQNTSASSGTTKLEGPAAGH